MSKLRHLPLSNRYIVCLVLFAGTRVSAGELGDGATREQALVTGNDVYVRSGASLNHYPVCKLNAGDHATILGEHGEWLEIVPPDGTFSWISAQYVDSVDGRDGVVNGDNVRVRAGSSLPKWAKSKYAVQTMLVKGSEVTILEENPDGFLKVVPPAEATLWVHRQFVERLSEDDALTFRPGDTPADTAAVSDAPPDSGAGDTRLANNALASSADGSPFSSISFTTQRKQLEQIDVEAKAEAEKPMLERRFAPLIARYQKVVDQVEDDFASRYAQTRVTQLAQLGDMIDAVRRTRQLHQDTDSQRRALLEERLKMQTVAIPQPTALDAQGLLKTSALYPQGSRLQRYRLIDPTTSDGRTIAYVQIPPDAGFNVADFLGQYVGVRAIQRRFQEGGVDTIPVYVAGELVILDSPEEIEK